MLTAQSIFKTNLVLCSVCVHMHVVYVCYVPVTLMLGCVSCCYAVCLHPRAKNYVYFQTHYITYCSCACARVCLMLLCSLLAS